MLSILYPISYIISLSGLIAWFYFQDNRAWSSLVSKIFIGGLLFYLGSLSMADGAIEYKLFVLSRDLVIMGVIASVFSYFRNNALLFFGMLTLLYGAFSIKGASVLESTFPEKSDRNINAQHSYEVAEQGELLVEIKEDYNIKDIQSILSTYNLKAERAFFPASTNTTTLDDYYLLDVPKQHTGQLEEIISALMETEGVAWAEENEVVRLSPMESTSQVDAKRKFSVNDPDIQELWGFEAMNVDQLYNGLSKSKIKPKKKALIAILDTGVDATHEDIAANFISTNKKYDKDNVGHGTHCAGVAAAVSNNGIGVASFSTSNQFVQVTSIKVLSRFGGTQEGIIDGMIKAADQGAAVISMSLGGMASRDRTRAYDKAVAYCNKKGAIVVTSAGNSNKSAMDNCPGNSKNVITVSAIDQNLNKASFSNYVSEVKMGIAAPGVGIYSTIPGNKYTRYNGTSMSAPYVSGLIGVLKSIQPDLTTKEVYNILHKSGIDTKDTKRTGRLIQPAKALEYVID